MNTLPLQRNAIPSGNPDAGCTGEGNMLRHHPTARVYILGNDLSASIVPYCVHASCVLIDMTASGEAQFTDGFGRPTAPIPIGENLSLHWTPERGFNHDPVEWLSRRRSRLATSPGMTVLVLSELLATMLRKHMDDIHATIGRDDAPDFDDLEQPHILAQLEDLA